MRKRESWKIGDLRVINSKKRSTVELSQITMRIMPWWWAIIATGTSILLGAAAWFVAWSIAKHDATLKIEAIKIGLSVTAGVGAASGLLLAFRRQMHNEYVAQDSAFDAAQRRVTELYAKSVEQLGHDKAAVRLGDCTRLNVLGRKILIIVKLLLTLSAPTFECHISRFRIATAEALDQQVVCLRAARVKTNPIRSY